MKIPPSLRNIYKELTQDAKVPGFTVAPDHGYLKSWASQGVFLLNTVLTVRYSKANSHKSIGWTKFTTACLEYLNKKKALYEHQEFLISQMDSKRETELAISHMEKAQQRAQVEANRAYEMALQRELKALEEQKPQGLKHISTLPRGYRR